MTKFIVQNKNYYLIAFLIAIPIIIYLYFLKWETVSAYGDDLYVFKNYSGLDNFSDKINLPVNFGKYRPVQGLGIYILIEWFQKNLHAYYLFNIGVQTIITLLFAMLLNLFLKSQYFSLFFSLIIGLSRFSYFNISQLLNGGALEGLAMAFFLASLYFLLRVVVKDDLSMTQKQRGLIWSVVFANLSMYTHERYILMLPFIALTIFLLPSLKALSQKNKIGIILFAVVSIILNVVVKKDIYSLPFFTGTAGTNIDFSFSSAFSFFGDAILSLLQINSGPEYLAGISFSSLPLLNQILAITLTVSILLIFVVYLVRVRSFFVLKQKNRKISFYTFLLLSALAILFLLPAVITIRLEPRWLQACFSLFILLVVIAFNNLEFKSSLIKNYLFSVFIILFFTVDATYFIKGIKNLSMTTSLHLASKFENAIKKGLIHQSTQKIYIWEMKKDENTETAIKWILADGYFFNFYQGKEKNIYFVDSIYRRNYSFAISSFGNFDRSTEQIIYINDDIIDISGDYLKDSLKSFTPEKAAMRTQISKIQYDTKDLLITNDDFDKFFMTGFYDNENGIRWTNGKASVGFLGNYTIKDSFDIELNTYMPTICKSVSPKISITDDNDKEYNPVFSTRKGDQFIFKFYFNEVKTIQKINILSDTITAAPPDIRILSFPFISLKIRR